MKEALIIIDVQNDYFFIEGTDGVKISDRIKPAEEDKIIIKHYPNSFQSWMI